MSVAVCRGPAMPAFEPSTWLRAAAENTYSKPEVAVDDRPAQADIWNAIQADVVDKSATTGAKKAAAKPYVHPLVRRSSSLMSQKSLEVCTESLGSETGSGDFTASLDDVDMASLFGAPAAPASKRADQAAEDSFWQQSAAPEEAWERKELAAVNYHCSGGTRSPPRSFPPPLPSMSSRDAPCLQMRPRRQDGRLIVDAVVVRPRGYLHARRQGGRLLLSFVDCSAREQSAASKAAVATEKAPYFPVVDAKHDQDEEVAAEVEEDKVSTQPQTPTAAKVHRSTLVINKFVGSTPLTAPYFPVVDAKHDQDEEVAAEVEEDDEVEEEEEEVEVVDRGTVVEVKVSTQPQTPTAAKVHRSTLVINKFVGSTPLTVADLQPRCNADAACAAAAAAEATTDAPAPALRRVPSSTSTTTLAAAVAVASTSTDGDDDDDEPHHPPGAAAPAADTKQLLLFTSRCRDKQELLQSVRQCRQLRQKPLFILEPYCIATS
uniref:FAF domain-containing protein n=1 Tax=Oryza barthii TaxID=65489 RepID=A0A0D3FN08_9ORYZ